MRGTVVSDLAAHLIARGTVPPRWHLRRCARKRVASRRRCHKAWCVASPELDKEFRALFADMAAGWRSAPEPEGVHLDEVNRAALAGVGVVAVIHGWMARLVRTGEAALLCDQHGYAEEASPLIRSMLEHAIGLWWLVDQRGDAFQALVRSRSNQMQKLDAAQEHGWSIGDEEAQRLLKEAIAVVTDEESKAADNLLAVAHQAREYGLSNFAQAWLLESWTSHASTCQCHRVLRARARPRRRYGCLHPAPRP
jgi:hypothetical protein